MKPIFLLDSQLARTGKDHLGGKAHHLHLLARDNYPIPLTACIPCSVYNAFVGADDLRERIQLELNRKELADCRWEELWDIALRIRNIFLKTPIPAPVEQQLSAFIDRHFPTQRLVVRSSSPEEDSQQGSFAGLHASYLNISGVAELIIHVKKVWASLWSDKALLYRQELGLSTEKSTMAVIVQQFIPSEISGVVFSQNPADDSQMVIESVYGLNQGLVDGQVEPDRWLIDRDSGTILDHQVAAERTAMAAPAEQGVVLVARLPADKPPLDDQKISTIQRVALELEKFFGCPQDVEWTWAESRFFILQSRAITGLSRGDKNDKRAWYLSLTRSYAHLQKLASEIQDQFLPEMEQEARTLSTRDLCALSDQMLAAELKHRQQRYERWVTIYWDECIPFAHGIRLFGEVYNDLMVPDDPYEFVSLLSGKELLSTSRNLLMGKIAARLKAQPKIRSQLLAGRIDEVDDQQFRALFSNFKTTFGNPFNLYNIAGAPEQQADQKLLRTMVQYAQLPDLPTPASSKRADDLEQIFIARMKTSGHSFAGEEILELGRTSYRLRDDDNIILGKMEQQVEAAAGEARARLLRRGIAWAPQLQLKEILEALVNSNNPPAPPPPKAPAAAPRKSALQARQLIGQPASSGIAKGSARLIDSGMRLEEMRAGEVLVVDAIDPNMTFVAPLASAIVERRGGMLIHGAIIAREYGIPCVTGVHDLTDLVKTGDLLTVDGYLGLVTIQQPTP